MAEDDASEGDVDELGLCGGVQFIHVPNYPLSDSFPLRS